MVFLNNKTDEEKIKLAKSCDDEKTQRELAGSCNINIRKALAKNPSLGSSIANFLVFDPSINVSFHASKNSNCTHKRSFSSEDLAHKCIKCDIDELILDCNTCSF